MSASPTRRDSPARTARSNDRRDEPREGGADRSPRREGGADRGAGGGKGERSKKHSLLVRNLDRCTNVDFVRDTFSKFGNAASLPPSLAESINWVPCRRTEPRRAGVNTGTRH